MRIQNTLLAAAAAGILVGSSGSVLVGCGETTPSAASPTAAGMPAKHDCKGKNECKGQGGCKTDKNACKGQNGCKGQGGCKTA
jgi:hypothetical protein